MVRLLVRGLHVLRRGGHGALPAITSVRVLHIVMVLTYVYGVAEPVLRNLASPVSFRVIRIFVLLIASVLGFAVRTGCARTTGGATSAGLTSRVLVGVRLAIVAPRFSGIAAPIVERTTDRYVAPGWSH